MLELYEEVAVATKVIGNIKKRCLSGEGKSSVIGFAGLQSQHLLDGGDGLSELGHLCHLGIKERCHTGELLVA